ncbi:MAG: hypothetical protein R2832_16680 [Rhodothermales bacterium]
MWPESYTRYAEWALRRNAIAERTWKGPHIYWFVFPALVITLIVAMFCFHEWEKVLIIRDPWTLTRFHFGEDRVMLPSLTWYNDNALLYAWSNFAGAVMALVMTSAFLLAMVTHDARPTGIAYVLFFSAFGIETVIRGILAHVYPLGFFRISDLVELASYLSLRTTIL